MPNYLSMGSTTWPSLLRLWGLEHASYLARVVIVVWPHVHMLSSIYNCHRLDSTYVNEVILQWLHVSNGKRVLSPTMLVLQWAPFFGCKKKRDTTWPNPNNEWMTSLSNETRPCRWQGYKLTKFLRFRRRIISNESRKKNFKKISLLWKEFFLVLPLEWEAKF